MTEDLDSEAQKCTSCQPVPKCGYGTASIRDREAREYGPGLHRCKSTRHYWSGLTSARLFLASLLESCLTEELLATTAFLNDLDESWLQLLDGWDVVGEDTHLTSLCGKVDLDTVEQNIVSFGNSSSVVVRMNGRRTRLATCRRTRTILR